MQDILPIKNSEVLLGIPDKLDIRNPVDLKNFPELSDIREAVINAFEDFVENNYNSVNQVSEQEIQDIINDAFWYSDTDVPEDTFNYFLEQNKISINNESRDILESFVFFYLILKGKCETLVRDFLSDLQYKFPGKYNCFIVESSSNTKYFNNHFVAIVESKEAGLWYCLSPNNIFNPNFSYPKRKGEVYERLRYVFVGKSYEEVLGKMRKYEYGRWPKFNSVEVFEDLI